MRYNVGDWVVIKETGLVAKVSQYYNDCLATMYDRYDLEEVRPATMDDVFEHMNKVDTLLKKLERKGIL